jgi:hypothetical protein
MEASKSFCLSTKLRAQCVQSVISSYEALHKEEAPWLSVGLWEASQAGYWPDFPEVVQNLHDYLSVALPLPSSPKVFYVCGEDHFMKCGLRYGLGSFGVVVVPRSGDGSGLLPEPRKAEGGKMVFVAAADEDVRDLSSTAIRKAMSSGSWEVVAAMMGPTSTVFLRDAFTKGPAAVSSAASDEACLPRGQGRRRVFLSASVLASQARERPGAVPCAALDDALFLFGSQRQWLFPLNDAERAQSHDAGYGDYPEALRAYLFERYQRGQVSTFVHDN